MERNRLVYRHLDGTIVSVGTMPTMWEPKLVDSEGNEVKIPECERCRGLKSMVMGEESFSWVCLGCHNTVVGDAWE